MNQLKPMTSLNKTRNKNKINNKMYTTNNIQILNILPPDCFTTKYFISCRGYFNIYLYIV